MKFLATLVSLLFLAFTSYLARSQGTFQNLDFELAQLPVIPAGQSGGIVAITNSLPYWQAYIGTNAVFTTRHNDQSIGEAAITVLGPNYGFSLQGSFTPVLQAGRDPFGNGSENAPVSIAQAGIIPFDSQSLRFLTSPNSHDFSVVFGGITLPTVLLSTSPSAWSYGADVSSLAGQVGELRFIALVPTAIPFNNLYLDQIIFSQLPIPEPSTLGLFGLGALLVGWHLRRKRADEK